MFELLLLAETTTISGLEGFDLLPESAGTVGKEGEV